MGKTAPKRISVLDLEELREAFKISAHEHHVEGPEWADYAAAFLKGTTDYPRHGKAPDLAHQPPGP